MAKKSGKKKVEDPGKMALAFIEMCFALMRHDARREIAKAMERRAAKRKVKASASPTRKSRGSGAGSKGARKGK